MTEENPEHPPNIPEPSRAQIKAVRNYFGWNQAEAAGRFDVGHTTLMDLERGFRKPWGATQAKIGLAMLRLGIKFEGANIILPPNPPNV